jgi:hypothetical protein
MCLDVHLNGAKVCRAGLGKHGLVHLNAAWHSLPPAWKSETKRTSAGRAAFGVSGVLYDRRPPVHENLSWADGQLAVGDELSVRLVKARASDEPTRRERTKPIPETDQWDMIQSRLDGCVRDLRGLKGIEAKRLARELRLVLDRARGGAAQQGVAAAGASRRR